MPSERFPVIRSVRSNFDAFLATLPEVVSQASDVARRLNLMLSDANLRSVTRMVENLDLASRALPGTMLLGPGGAIAKIGIPTIEEIELALPPAE